MSSQSEAATMLVAAPRATEAGESRVYPVFPEATLARAREMVMGTRAVPVLCSSARLHAFGAVWERPAAPGGDWLTKKG